MNLPCAVVRLKECAAPPGIVCDSRTNTFFLYVADSSAAADRPPKPEPITITSGFCALAELLLEVIVVLE